MKTLTLNVRLISAAIAVATTLGLFGTVVSLAEPQRSALMARNQRMQTLPAATVEVAMASNSVTPSGK
jgi:biopolymer transport protein ExbB/TolQ